LIGAWIGRTITKITAPASSPNPKKYATGCEWSFFSQFVRARPIDDLRRHGKSLEVSFANTAEYWYIHLSSTGWFMPGNEAAMAVAKTDGIYKNFLHSVNDGNVRVRFHLDDGQIWNYHDPRTWGKWEIRSPLLSTPSRGPDWISDQPAAILALQSYQSKRTVKDVLCDQSISAGLGNYLAVEACFLAGIHPHARWSALTDHTKRHLGRAAAKIVNDSLASDSHAHWNVFDKAGKQCPIHAEQSILYTKDGKNGKRGSYFCPICQPLIQV